MNDKLKNALGNIDESLIEEAANAHSSEHRGVKIAVGITASAAAVAAVAVGVNTLIPKRGVDLIDTVSRPAASSAQPMSTMPLWLSSVIPVNELARDWTYEACNNAPVLILADMEQSGIAVVADWRYESAHVCRVKDNAIISLNIREAVETGLGLIKFDEYGMEYNGEYEILGSAAINYDGSSNAVFIVKCHGTSADGNPTEADICYRLYEDADGWKISPLTDRFGITETTENGAVAIVEPKASGSLDDISDRTNDGAIETNGCLVSLEKIKIYPKEFETHGADNDICLWRLNVLDRSGEYSLYPFIKDLYAGIRSTDGGTDTYYLAESYQGGRFIMWSKYMSAVNGRLFSTGDRVSVSEFCADFADEGGKLVMQAEKTIPNSFLTLPAGFEFSSPDSAEPQNVPMPEGEDNGLTMLFSESANIIGQESDALIKGISMTIDRKGSSGDMTDEEAMKLYVKGTNIFGLGYDEMWSMVYWETEEVFDDGSGTDNLLSTESIIITPVKLKDDILYACSPTDGTVIEATTTHTNNGDFYDVVIDAGNGICMSLAIKAGSDGEGGFCVSVGDEVKTGDKLLIEDKMSSYSALNFVVWNNGTPLDPESQTFDIKVRTGLGINAYDSTMSNYLQRIILEKVSKPDDSEQPKLSYPLDLSVYENLSYGTGHDGQGNYHGITIHTDISGTPLHAGGDGTVAAVYDKNSTGCPDFIYEELGNYVIIDHGHGYCTLYGCMDEITVSVGDTVKEGDVIGTAGRFGDNSLYYRAYYDAAGICAFPIPRSDAAPHT